MKIFVDDLPFGVKSITLDVSFHNVDNNTIQPVLNSVQTVGAVNIPEKESQGPVVPEVPVNIEDRPEKEIPPEMQDISF
jgi:hypothetical protein